jgi:hypothetical protein
MRAFRAFVSIRLLFWIGTMLTLFWAPLPPEKVLNERAWGALSDRFFGTFVRWDAQWFLQVARDGYTTTSAAFFPLYPLVVHVLGSSIVTGTLVSLVAGGIAAIAVAEIAPPSLRDDSVLLLALFPTAYVFSSVYSDGLFLALSAWSFLFAQRGQAWRAGIAGALACATRLLGLALLPALVLLLWPRERRDSWRLAPLLLLPAAVAAYALYLDWKVGDAFAFSHAQVFWERETPALGPLSGLWWAIEAGGHGARDLLFHLPRGQALGQPQQIHFWNAVHLVLLVPAAWLTWIAWTRISRAAGLYSFATLLIVLAAPSKGFPLVSFPRFLLGDFPIVLALADVLQGRPRVRQWTLIGFGAASAAAGVAFSRGVWIA